MAANWIGIDLGTSKSAVACTDSDGNPLLIPLSEFKENTNDTMPSVIFFTKNKKVSPDSNFDGVVLVGKKAKEALKNRPKQGITHFKRFIGDRSWLFYPFGQEGCTYSAVELSAFVLKYLKTIAEKHLNIPVHNAVIGVPANFTIPQREGTEEASKLAGFKEVQLFNEPTAAALAYGFSEEVSGKKVLVYDFGGGTFDVTLLEMNNNEFNVVGAPEGDFTLGGKNFDDILTLHIVKKLKENGIENINIDDPLTQSHFRIYSEEAKIELSTCDFVQKSIPILDKPITIYINRKDFEDNAKEDVDKSIDFIKVLLEKRGMTTVDISKVLLVGSTSRMPLIRRKLNSLFGEEPDLYEPEKAIVMGMAIKAKMLQTPKESMTGKIAQINIQDVASHTLGIKAFDESGKIAIRPLIKKGTQVPVSRKIKFKTSDPDQEFLSFFITQGEENIIDLEEVRFGPLLSKEKMVKHLEITFSYDSSSRYSIEGIDSAGRKIAHKIFVVK